MCAGCAAQGLCSIPGHSQPRKACSLTLPHTRIAGGVQQSHTQNKGPKLPLGVICLLHNLPWGAITASTTTKWQIKLVNNKKHRKNPISVTHIAVCKPLRAPSCAPTLSRSASCLCYCRSPSSVQGTVWPLIEVSVQVGL